MAITISAERRVVNALLPFTFVFLLLRVWEDQEQKREEREKRSKRFCGACLVDSVLDLSLG